VWASLFAFALVGRYGARRFAAAIAADERCLLVGDLGGSGAIGRRLRDERSLKATLCAVLPLDLEHDHERALTALAAAVQEHDADRVVLAPQRADSDAVLDAIRLLKSLGVKVSLLPRLFEVVGSSVVFDDVRGVTLLGVRRFGLSRSSAIVKRTLDLTGATLGLLAVAPLMLVFALAIRITSPGPIFFRQERVGRDGEHFQMLKFRSMVDGAERLKAGLQDRNESEGLFKITDDPRITRIGKLLRGTSLDELPQLINVLRGDMSLVGPRPLVVAEDALVRGWHRRRLHLTPGMTGPWQILGSTRVPLQEMVKIDYLYIANWSFWTDVKIMLRTVVHMLGRSGM
jgi:exopolysaccharide biosynthesis polyprenyl glycosylphosphotransferase